jgi:galactan 5-O-arabinofuranosyltransferase
MVRIGFLISYFILPILAFEVWKKIVNKKTSFFITAVFFTFIANYFEIIWIDHLIGYLFFIPFFIYYFENYTKKDFKRKDYIIAGILGSILICTFYLYFILVPIYLIIGLIQNKIQDDIEIFKIKFKRILYIMIIIMIFSSWFWITLIIDIIFIGFESHQNYFFPKYALDLPFEAYFEFNLFSILLILGVVFILIKYSTSDLMKILGNIVLSVYILYFLGYIGIIIGFPLVHYRVLIVSHYVLIIAFVLFYIQFFNILREHKILDQYKHKVNFRTIEIFVLIIIIFYQNYENTVELYKSEYYERSINQEIPDEIDIFLELDYEDKVFLTQYYEVAAYLPIYLFIVHNAHFSHPSALNNERAKFLKELSECKSSKEFYEKIMNNKFGPIDYFILEPCDDNATEFLFDTAQLEYFPERWDVKIYFREELFESSSYFERYKIKGEIIYRTIY